MNGVAFGLRLSYLKEVEVYLVNQRHNLCHAQTLENVLLL